MCCADAFGSSWITTTEFEQGQMMILSAGVFHSVEALDETAFVIFISAPV